MKKLNKIKYLKRLKRKLDFIYCNKNSTIYNYILKSLIEKYKENNILFFRFKIFFKDNINYKQKLKLINYYINVINKKIKLLEFIYINNNNKNPSLLIGVKSIIGYSNYMIKNYKSIFKNNRNIKIKYIFKNNNKLINQIIKTKNLEKQRFLYKKKILNNYDSFIEIIFQEIYKDIKSGIKIPKNWKNLNKKKYKYLGKSEDKLDNQFNNEKINSVRKISKLSIINIFKVYCLINDIYYSKSDNKLYKKKFNSKFYTDKQTAKLEGCDLYMKKIIKIKLGKKKIKIYNNCYLADSSFEEKAIYIYFGELNYFINNINLIMDLILKLYFQQVNRYLIKKMILKYFRDAYKLVKEMPSLYLREIYL